MSDENLNNDSLLDPDRTDPNAPENEVTPSEEVKEPETKIEPEETGENEEPQSGDELPLPEEPTEEKNKLPKWAEKRLSKKDQRIAELEMEIQHKSQAQNQPQFQSPELNIQAPKREDFENEDDYIDARFAYNNKKSFLESKAIEDQKQFLQKEVEFRKNWTSSFEEGSARYEDFEDKTSILNHPSFPPNRAMAEAIVDSEHKLDILYFLGTYPDEARKYAAMNPIQAVKKIAQLEARFAEKRKSNKITKAPPPPIPLKGNKGMASEGDPNKMGQTDFEDWYRSKYGAR